MVETLSHAELAAALAHERCHLEERDNLKRFLIRACGDLLWFLPWGRSADRAWAEATESAADEYPARSSSSAALDLAGAMITLARLAPPGATPGMPAAALIVGVHDGCIETRIRRLLDLTDAGAAPLAPVRRRARLGALAALALTLSGGMMLAAAFLLPKAHAALELLVCVLQ